MESKMAFLDFEDEAELEGEDGAFKDSIIEPVYREKVEKASSNSLQGRAPTLTIEVVCVSRPLKIISLLLAVVALVLMIIASCFSNWMYIGPAQMGLFHECFPEDAEGEIYTCTKTDCYSYSFFIAMILVLVGIFLLLLGIFFLVSGLLVYSRVSKRYLYNATVGFFILATLFCTACLITFPINFLIQFSDDKFQVVGHGHGNGEIAPGFALFVGVGGVLVLIISTILLIIDKRADEIIYREKINQ
nr:P53 induced protein [Hymenolepis microstoma]